MATRILIVEDELIVAQDLRSTLESLDYEVCAAVDSGEAALEATENLRPDLVLMDIVLAGEMTGTEAAGVLRQRGIPVVFLTAYTDDDALEKAGVTDPAGYVVKPFQDKELRSVVEIALHKARIEDRRRQAELALRQSEQRFREMAESVRKVFWLFDWCEQKVIYVSPAYEEIWNRPVQDLYDRYEEWMDSIHPEDREFAAESFARIAETGGGEEREYRIVRPDGSIRWISDEGFAVYDETGTVCRIAGVAVDITAHRLVLDGLRNARDELEGRVAVATAELRREIDERKRMEAALREQLDFERLVSEISGWFISLDCEIETRILESLERIGAFFDADGVVFGEFSLETRAYRVRHAWLADPDLAKRTAAAAQKQEFPNLVPHLLTEGELVFGCMDEHPKWPEEVEYLELGGYQAGAFVTVTVAEEVLYGMGVVSLVEREWPVDIVARLRLLGKLVALGLTRARSEEKTQAEQKLLRKMLAIHERDRRIVAHDIHDEVVQCALGAHFMLGAARKAMGPQNETVQRRLDKLAQLLQDAAVKGRRIVNQQSSAVIDKEGVVHAIRDLIADEQIQSELEVRFHHDVQFDRLDPMLENTAFRIVQECLNNVRRHSQAERAEVRLVQDNDQLRIQICDQGVGFESRQVPDDCFGLRGVCERARLLGGHADIDSFPGKGTRITVDLPTHLNGEDEGGIDWDSLLHL